MKFDEPTRDPERRVALTVALVFGFAGTAWILFSDVLLYGLTRNFLLTAQVEAVKGLVFVTGSALLLYAVTLRGALRLTRAQAAMSAIVDSIGDGVLLLGPDRTVAHANPAAVRMLGCEHLRDLVGMGAPEFSRRFRVSYADGSLVPPTEFVSQRVFSEGGPLRYKAILHPPHAQPLHTDVTAAAVRPRPDVPAEMVVSVMHDVTVADELEDLRDHFFAAAAHSLKTPVAVIKTHVELLSRSDPSLIRRSIGPIERQCDRIDRLVQNLMVLSRVRSRTLRLHPSQVELGPLVAAVAREMAGTSRDHALHTELLASPRAHVDQERVSLTLRNVIDTALRTSPSGSEVLVLLAERGADAVIGVRYHALPPEERVSAGFSDYDDLSIGHSVSTTIVEAHGGTLREEAVGAETTAWIQLPAIEESHEHA